VTKSGRTNLILAGVLLVTIGRIFASSVASSDVVAGVFLFYVSGLCGLALVLWGCYMWTRLKGRHWAFMFWGLLAPIGLLGISLLKDKTKVLSK